MTDVILLYCTTPENLSSTEMVYAMSTLPESIIHRILRYSDLQDRLLRITGKLLLRQLLVEYFGKSGDVLNQIVYSEFNKPYIPGHIDFSIAHSGSLVLCAATDAGKIGVDTERLKNIDPSVFDEHFTEKEMAIFTSSGYPGESLLKAWVRKECLMKASGLGVMLPMLKVDQTQLPAFIEGQPYYWTDLATEINYASAVATSFANPVTYIHQMDANALFQCRNS